MSSLTSAIRAVARPRTLATRLAPLAVIAVAVTALLPTLDAFAAQAPPPMGTASTFAVLAGAGITNTGPTTITGDTGSFGSSTAETGFAGLVTQTGTDHGGDAVTQQAKTDFTTAYNVAAGAASTPTLATGELAGLVLTPGVYTAPPGGFGITGTLTLNTLGDPSAVFIFKTDSTLTTAGASDVVVANGGLACNVFWQIGSSATLGISSHLIGTVLAATSITATTSATIIGRLQAGTGAVTLDTNTITNQGCPPPAPFVPPAATPTTTTAAPATTVAPTTTKAPTTTTKAPTTTAVPAKKAVLLPGSATPTTTPGTPAPIPGTPTPTPGTPTPTPGVPTPPVPGTPPLPFTGFSIGWPLLVGGVTLAFGLSVLALSHRRDHRLGA